jgi:exportin-7
MLFDSNDRQKYLDQIVNGLKRVLESPEKLSYPVGEYTFKNINKKYLQDNFHHFCRIISRVKANYQVSELVKCEDFNRLLQLLTEFTMQSFPMSHMFTQNSIYYLMSFWSRLAGSLTYARVDVEVVCLYRK